MGLEVSLHSFCIKARICDLSSSIDRKFDELSEKLLRDNQARLEAGVLNSTEVRITETQLMRNRHSLLSSRLDALRIEDQVRAALNLKNLP